MSWNSAPARGGASDDRCQPQTCRTGADRVAPAGLSQLFTGAASIDAFVHAEIGSIHLAASAAADTAPFRYAAPFPGALGENPFYAQADVGITGCCDDVVTVPATQNAPNAGDLTSVRLAVAYSGHESAGADDPIDLREAPRPSAFLSLADGTDLGGVISGSRTLGNIPVLTPIALRFCFGGRLVVTAGHDLVGALDGIIFRHGGDYASDHAFYDALNTAEIQLVNEDGAGATGATGHDYGNAERRVDDHDDDDHDDDLDLRAALDPAELHGVLR